MSHLRQLVGYDQVLLDRALAGEDRALHAQRFSLGDDEQVPEDGPLAWDYAGFLAVVQREAVRVARFVRLCRRRRWALVIELD